MLPARCLLALSPLHILREHSPHVVMLLLLLLLLLQVQVQVPLLQMLLLLLSPPKADMQCHTLDEGACSSVRNLASLAFSWPRWYSVA